MFCPVCKYEFRRGFTRCNTCDVDLVETLPAEEEIDHTAPTSAAEPDPDRPVLLWSGASGGFYSALTLALESAQVPYNKEELDARMVFTSQHVDLEVWVSTANLFRAEAIRDGLLANPLYANEASSAPDFQNQDDAGDELLAALSDEVRDEDDERPRDIPTKYVSRELYSEDATSEVWSGQDEMMADVLKSCLAEVGINCYVESPESPESDDFDSDASSGAHPDHESNGSAESATLFAVRVLPQDERRARQIVRAVTDGAAQ
jgi:hypothetical protein